MVFNASWGHPLLDRASQDADAVRSSTKASWTRCVY